MKNDNQHEDFMEKCRSIDFSAESANKEKNLELLKDKLKNIENEREINMKKKIKKPMAIAAVAATLLCLSMAVYGQDLIRIIKTVTLGNHAEYSVIEDNREFIPIPEEVKGQVFDKDGNELTVFSKDAAIYNANGEEAFILFENDEIKVSTQGYREPKTIDFYDIQEGSGYFICDTLFPSYMPEGYSFDRITFYGDPTDKDSMEQGANKYMNVYYSDGENEIYSQVRYMDEETAFQLSASEDIQKTKINGHDAVIDRHTLNIQIDDVMYMFFANEDLSVDELVKMAESLK